MSLPLGEVRLRDVRLAVGDKLSRHRRIRLGS